MSSIYLKIHMELKNPAIGFVKYWNRRNKGNDLVKESYHLLKEKAEELAY